MLNIIQLQYNMAKKYCNCIWTALLASAVHNNQENTTTGLSPNQILLGYETTLIPDQSPSLTNETAQRRLQSLLKHRAKAIDAINRTAR